MLISRAIGFTRSSTRIFRSPLSRYSAAVVSEKAEEALPTNKNSDLLLRIRHSSAHVMAMAVQNLYPSVQVTIGPWIDNGFYYDFFHTDGSQFAEDDLKMIKKEMDSIIKKKIPMVSSSRALIEY